MDGLTYKLQIQQNASDRAVMNVDLSYSSTRILTDLEIDKDDTITKNTRLNPCIKLP